MQTNTLIIVDDDHRTRNALTRALRSDNRIIIDAENGVDALAKLKGTKVDLILSDMRMPEMDGAELLSNVVDPTIRRIMITGYADMDRTLAAINEGAVNRYMLKPWNNQELRQIVDDELEIGNTMRQAASCVGNLNLEISSLNSKIGVYSNLLETSSSALQDKHQQAIAGLCTNLMAERLPLKRDLCRRVLARALVVAREMNLDPEQKALLIEVVGLHRIGELFIPLRLAKQCFAKMSPAELQEYAAYVDHSVRVSTNRPSSVQEILSHHRRGMLGARGDHPVEPVDLIAGILEMATEFEELCLFMGEKPNTQMKARAYLASKSKGRYLAEIAEVFWRLF